MGRKLGLTSEPCRCAVPWTHAARDAACGPQVQTGCAGAEVWFRVVTDGGDEGHGVRGLSGTFMKAVLLKQLSGVLLSPSGGSWWCWRRVWGVERQAVCSGPVSLHSASLPCADTAFFLQIGGLRRPRAEQVRWCHFPTGSHRIFVCFTSKVF